MYCGKLLPISINPLLDNRPYVSSQLDLNPVNWAAKQLEPTFVLKTDALQAFSVCCGSMTSCFVMHEYNILQSR